jgi:hypothetical protein
MHRFFLKNVGLECFKAPLTVQSKAIPMVSPEVQTEEWKALGVKAAKLPKWARTQKGTWE